MTGPITIKCVWGTERIAKAEIFGEWAVHQSWNGRHGPITVTHIESGLSVDEMIGWAVDHLSAARRVAKALRRVHVPKALWGADRHASEEANSWAQVIEATAGEVLAGLLDPEVSP